MTANFLDQHGNHTVRANRYGVQSTNVVDPAAWGEFLDSVKGSCSLTDPKLVKIVRLRLLTDAGFPWWDISYCYGQLADGTYVSVSLMGIGQLRKARGGYRAHLVEIFREAKRYGRGMGIFDDGVISTMR